MNLDDVPPAGRNLDALVARFCLGKTVRAKRMTTLQGVITAFDYLSGEREWKPVKPYSTDPAATREVLDYYEHEWNMMDKPSCRCFWRIESADGGLWRCSILRLRSSVSPDALCINMGYTFMEAVCRAAVILEGAPGVVDWKYRMTHGRQKQPAAV